MRFQQKGKDFLWNREKGSRSGREARDDVLGTPMQETGVHHYFTENFRRYHLGLGEGRHPFPKARRKGGREAWSLKPL